MGSTYRSSAAARAARVIDKRIEAAFVARCRGIQIDVMDISKVFAAGRAAIAAGLDLEGAIVACVATLRRN